MSYNKEQLYSIADRLQAEFDILKESNKTFGNTEESMEKLRDAIMQIEKIIPEIKSIFILEPKKEV